MQRDYLLDWTLLCDMVLILVYLMLLGHMPQAIRCGLGLLIQGDTTCGYSAIMPL